MPINPNMVAIETVTVGAGGASSIDFQNIPQTYTDLVILLSARQSTSPFQGQRLYFNNTDTNLRNNYLLGTGSGTQASAAATGYFGSIAGTNVSASIFDNTFIYISNYTSTSLVKTFSAENIAPANDNLAYLGITNGTWNSTSAITRVTLFPDGGGSYTQYSSATLYGVTSAAVGAKATGGIISSDANYYYHTFLASGTFTPTQSLSCDYLVVAGAGGGGAAYGGGGGGAGGYKSGSLAVTGSTNYTVTIGAGGAGSPNQQNNGSNGSNSIFSSITSTGGGGGSQTGGGSGSGSNGGSGGGGAGGNNDRSGGGTASPSGEGNNGGTGSYNNAGNFGAGGGGGGASASGGNGTSSTTAVGGNGGNGTASSISGSSITYAGGGGGGAFTTGESFTRSSGGSGGGGAGGDGNNASGNAAVAGTANTGGGGGGGGFDQVGAAGGSGIVIVRYAK